jgi:hypothetical protein
LDFPHPGAYKSLAGIDLTLARGFDGAFAMSGISARHRHPWSDRFRTPTAEALVADLPKSLIPAFEHARKCLSNSHSLAEAVHWQGVWQWCLTYTHNGDSSLPAAYLVPDPDRPRLCIPFPEHALHDLPLKRLAKSVRDVLIHAPAVNGVRWATWDLHSKAGVDEVLALLAHRAPSQNSLAGAT